MGLFVSSLLLAYAGLFPIVNPVGSAPIFLGLIHRSTEKEGETLARRVAINSFLLLVGSLFLGSHVLVFFGISLPVLRIGGGLVVAAFGWKLLNSSEPSTNGDEATSMPSTAPDSFYPLTMPLTVGPGAISVAVALGSQRPKAADLAHLALLGGGAVTGILAIAVTVYLCYRFAERLVRLLGSNGTNVVLRLSAFILLCIGIQIVWGGLSELPFPRR
jgi:multiple antibiotic resistance protein